MNGENMVNWILWNLGTSDYIQGWEWEKQYHFYNITTLEDGWNDPEIVAVALKDILETVQKQKERVVIMCTAGISRSNALAMGILVLNNNMSWEDAFNIVKKMIPQADPNAGIIDATKQAIAIIKKMH